MDIETYDFSFSVDQPETVLKPLLDLLQKEPDQSKIGTSRSVYLLETQSILIIDSDRALANTFAQFIDASGYRSVIAETALEAFTLFLKGIYIPKVVFLGQDISSNHLFLQRLIQQTQQKYGRKVPLIRLHMIGSATQSTSPYTRTPSQPLQKLSTHELQQTMSGIEQIEREKISLEGLDIGRYHIESLLGSGLQGSVYQTYDRLREHKVALKAVQMSNIPFSVVRVSEEEINLFQQESDMLGILDHAHIQAPLNTGRSYVSGAPFVYKTMPYYPEKSLAHWLPQHGRQKAFLAREVLHVALQLADALQYIHDHQILYQNFKMSNLLIRDPSDEMRGLHLIISDFAIAQDGSFFSRTVDAYPYMAPERWQNIALPASDQYGLAAIIYELLTKRPPFQGSSEYTMRLLHANMQPQPPSSFNPMLTPAIDHVLLRALSKKPEDRFPSIEVFAQMLQRYC